VFLTIHSLSSNTGNRSCIMVRYELEWPLTVVSVDMLSLTGRTQAFSLGESFAEHYGFTLLDNKGNYTVEFAGILSLAIVDKVNIESRRRRVGLRWVSGESIIQTRSNLNPFRNQRVSL